MLARYGAKVVVNDVQQSSATRVADEISARGGEAMAVAASVTDESQVAAMIDRVMEAWGRVDILINNAGILRDKTFAKMTLADFRHVLEVHLMGSVICTQSMWEIMRQQHHGRVVLTTSSSGLYGNFGQANYGAAKMALVGLMQTLALEGEKYDIRVNCLAPTAATQMTDGILTNEALARLDPCLVSPGLLALVVKDAPHAPSCARARATLHGHTSRSRKGATLAVKTMQANASSRCGMNLAIVSKRSCPLPDSRRRSANWRAWGVLRQSLPESSVERTRAIALELLETSSLLHNYNSTFSVLPPRQLCQRPDEAEAPDAGQSSDSPIHALTLVDSSRRQSAQGSGTRALPGDFAGRRPRPGAGETQSGVRTHNDSSSADVRTCSYSTGATPATGSRSATKSCRATEPRCLTHCGSGPDDRASP